jgi:hypothetical protein
VFKWSLPLSLLRVISVLFETESHYQWTIYVCYPTFSMIFLWFSSIAHGVVCLLLHNHSQMNFWTVWVILLLLCLVCTAFWRCIDVLDQKLNIVSSSWHAHIFSIYRKGQETPCLHGSIKKFIYDPHQNHLLEICISWLIENRHYIRAGNGSCLFSKIFYYHTLMA